MDATDGSVEYEKNVKVAFKFQKQHVRLY